jgi:hypothetical protein
MRLEEGTQMAKVKQLTVSLENQPGKLGKL